MSVYSGFATRKLECEYDNYIKNMFILIIDQLTCQIAYSKTLFNLNEFTSMFKQIHGRIKHLEDRKYLEPKLGHIFAKMIPIFDGNMTISNKQKSLPNQTYTIQTQVPLAPLRSRCLSNQESVRQKIEKIKLFANETPSFSNKIIPKNPQFIYQNTKTKFQQDYQNATTQKFYPFRTKQINLNLLEQRKLNFFNDETVRNQHPPNLEIQQYQKSEHHQNQTLYEMQL